MREYLEQQLHELETEAGVNLTYPNMLSETDLQNRIEQVEGYIELGFKPSTFAPACAGMFVTSGSINCE